MGEILINDIVDLFKTDLYLYAVQNPGFSDFMIKKHGWTKEEFYEYRKIYYNQLSEKWPWISVNTQKMPLEKFIIVSHKFGIEAISFSTAAWRYWYTGEPVKKEVLDTITHWWEPVISK
jgi:hypothetical protein